MDLVLSILSPLILFGGLVTGAVLLVRAVIGGGEEPLDPVEALKSFAVHSGLFVAFLVVTLALVDLGQRIVGSGATVGSAGAVELAQTMALLLVAIPAFGGLLFASERRRLHRHQNGDTRSQRGWSTYLVGALSVSLVVVLVYAAQLIIRLGDTDDPFELVDGVAPTIWLAVWGLHWFFLRPRFGVRGDAHLAIGSIVGLGWFFTGVYGLVVQVLGSAYASVFDDLIAENSGTAKQWLLVLLVGAVVWTWYWLLHFDRPGSVEGDRRRSSLWFFTTVIIGILPAVTVILWSVTAAIAGVLIWFLGDTTNDAASYFEPGVFIGTAVIVAVLSWAYHRWRLVSSGPAERNEALRFANYNLISLGLIGGATAATSLLLIAWKMARTGITSFAGGPDVANILIVTLTGLVVCTLLWRHQWGTVERHREADPIGESDSVWRKVYLVATFAVGGLALAITLVRIVFIVLRELLDGSAASLSADLSSPVASSIVIATIVWFHFAIWRADRAVLAGRPDAPKADGSPVDARYQQPFERSAAAPVVIRAATAADLGELFTLQRAAFVDEAFTYDTPRTPRLEMTFADYRTLLAASTTLVATEGHRIIGAISARSYRSGGVDIEGLMVAPDRMRQGIAARLLGEAERQLAAAGHATVQLIVGEIATGPRALYESRGYAIASRDQAAGGPSLLTLHKSLSAPVEMPKPDPAPATEPTPFDSVQPLS